MRSFTSGASGVARKSAAVRGTVFALSLACGLAGGSTASHAGLLDFLFGAAPPQRTVAPPPPQTYPAAPSPEMMQQETMQEVPQPGAPRSIVTRKPENTSLCCKHGENPRAALMADPTLRPGDAVMTASGISVFEGEPGLTPHAPSDFVALAQAQTIAPESRARLQTLDRSHRKLPAPATN